MRTYALFLCIAIGIALPACGNAAGLNFTSFPTIDQFFSSLSGGNSVANLLVPQQSSTFGVVRLMRLTVTPAMPSPTDIVSVTIAVDSSKPYLVLSNSTVSRQGADVAIDLYWVDNPPVIADGILLMAQSQSLGYVVEQTPPNLSSVWASSKHEVKEVLGAFEAGSHKILVHSHGALEGEGSTLFTVREPLAIHNPFNPVPE
jgi:hypothetical protein